jgi:transposase
LLVDNYLQVCLDELANKPESLTDLLPWNFK